MPLSRPARLTALALLAACCAAFAPAPVYREPKPDRRTDGEKLQGKWVLVSYSFHGKAVATTPGRQAVAFAGGRASLLFKGKETESYSFTLDPAASPKRLDLRHEKGTLLRCIYRLEGDRLMMALGDREGAPHPADFKGGPGVRITVYRRARRGK